MRQFLVLAANSDVAVQTDAMQPRKESAAMTSLADRPDSTVVTEVSALTSSSGTSRESMVGPAAQVERHRGRLVALRQQVEANPFVNPIQLLASSSAKRHRTARSARPWSSPWCSA